MDYWRGEKVELRGVEPEDVEVFLAWNHDSDMCRGVDRVWFPASREHVRHWVERAGSAPLEGDEFQFVIANHAGEMVGTLNTMRCDRRVGAFSYGVAVRREHQRQGYAHEAIRLVLRYFFDELRYQKVTADVYSYNEPSMRLHEKLGFQLEGRVRRTVLTSGRFADQLLFGMTDDEFRARYAAP
ncbi:MAG: GNAT family N-acetyltransferase [Anaerolineae bacterium]